MRQSIKTKGRCRTKKLITKIWIGIAILLVAIASAFLFSEKVHKIEIVESVKNALTEQVTKIVEESKSYVSSSNNEETNAIDSESEIPPDVQDFLDAINQIPPEITEENAKSVSELLYGICSDAYEKLLNTEYMEREDVREAEKAMSKAIDEVENILSLKSDSYYTEPLPGRTAHDIYYYNGEPECYLYLNIHPDNFKESYTNPSEILTTKVGEKESTVRLYTHSNICTNRSYCI